MSRHLNRLLTKTINVEPGEVRRVAAMFALLALIIGTNYVLKPVRSSLFLTEFGAERLPYAYMLIAFTLGIVATAFSRILPRFRLDRLFMGTALFFAASLLVFWAAMLAGLRYTAFVFYVWVSIIMILMPSLFWLLANYVFYSNEARRLFGTVTAGGLLGSIVGGGVTSTLADVAGTTGLLPIGAIVLVVIALLVGRIRRMERERLTERATELEGRERRKLAQADRSPLALITGSRYLSLLSILLAVTTVTSTLVDYQFSAIAEESFRARDALTGFFGSFFASVNVIAFVLQLAVAGRILSRLGVGAGLALLPTALLTSSLGFYLFPVLSTAALVKLSDDGLSNSINRSSVEILFLPVPLEVKNRTKAWLDIFVERTSRGIGGVLILVFTKLLALTTSQLSLIVLALVAPWIALTFLLRREYVKAFRSSLARRDIDVSSLTSDVQDPQTRKVLEQILAGSDEKQILYALELLHGSTDETFIEPVKKLADHPSKDVKTATLRMLGAFPEPPFLPHAAALAADEDPVLSAEAMSLLVRTKPVEGIARVADLLVSGDVEHIHAVLDTLGRIPGMLEEFLDEAFVRRYAHSENPEERALASRAIGFQRDNLAIHLLLPDLLNDPSPQVARAAAEAAGRLRQDWLVALLVNQLRRRPLRASARRALARFAEVGEEVVLGLLEDPTQDRQLLRALPRVLVEFPEQRTVHRLLGCLPQEDLLFHHQILKALGKLHTRHSHLRLPGKEIERVIRDDARRYADFAGKFTVVHQGAPSPDNEAHRLLSRALDERLDLMRENLFRALGLIYPSADIFNAWNGVVNGRPAVRAAALEFLGNVLSHEHWSQVLPLIQGSSWKEVYEKGAELFELPRIEHPGVLVELILGADPWLAACAATAAGELRAPELRETLRAVEDHPIPVVREAARAVLGRWAPVARD